MKCVNNLRLLSWSAMMGGVAALTGADLHRRVATFMPCPGSLIKHARHRRGLSQVELAALVQTHPTRVSRLEGGRERLALHTAEVFSSVLRLNVTTMVREVLQQGLQVQRLPWRVSVRRGGPAKRACAAIRLTRLELGLSLTEMARALGVSPPRVAEIERGEKLLKLDSACKVARVLRLPERRVAQWVLQDAVSRACTTRLVVTLR